MYQVIITDDETRERSYFYSYGEIAGNIETDELPPYQDINKARACYWDNNTWVYDPDKYTEICSDQQRQKEEAEKAQALAEATPTNKELCEAAMELVD